MTFLCLYSSVGLTVGLTVVNLDVIIAIADDNPEIHVCSRSLQKLFGLFLYHLHCFVDKPVLKVCTVSADTDDGNLSLDF